MSNISEVLGVSTHSRVTVISETRHAQIAASFRGVLSHWKVSKLRTYSPFAFGEILPDLGADGLVDVFVESCVTSDPETKAKSLLWCSATGPELYPCEPTLVPRTTEAGERVTGLTV